MPATFEAKLRALCIAYDNEYGAYPESDLEGLAIFDFFVMNGIDETTKFNNKYLKDTWDATDRWRNGEFSTTD